MSLAVKIEQYLKSVSKNEKDFHRRKNNMTKEDAQNIKRKNYVPKMKTVEELREEVKLKKNWVNPSSKGGEFGPNLVLKGEILEPWKAMRVNMPERSYAKFNGSKAIKPGPSGKDFGWIKDDKVLTEKYRMFLKDHNKKFDDYVLKPSKYTKPDPFLPQVLNYRPPFYVKRSEYDEFLFPKHNTFVVESRFRIMK